MDRIPMHQSANWADPLNSAQTDNPGTITIHKAIGSEPRKGLWGLGPKTANEAWKLVKQNVPDIVEAELAVTDGADLSPLAYMTSLRELEITFRGTVLPNMQPLIDLLARSHECRLSVIIDGAMADMSPARELSKLVTIRIFYPASEPTGVANLACLVGLSLHLSQSSFEEIGPICALPMLRMLDLDAEATGSPCLIKDFSPLKNLTELEWLSLHDTTIAELSPLSRLKKLRHLDLSETPVSDLSPLNGLDALEWLDASGTLVRDLPSDLNLNALRFLDLRWNSINDISGLAGMKSLETLILPLKNLTPFQGLKSLKKLDLSGSDVRNLTPLAKLRNLQTLILDGTVLADLTPLTASRSLQFISLVGATGFDLRPFAQSPIPRTLVLDEDSEFRNRSFLRRSPHLQFQLKTEGK